jgi:hypothetical protein
MKVLLVCEYASGEAAACWSLLSAGTYTCSDATFITTEQTRQIIAQ